MLNEKDKEFIIDKVVAVVENKILKKIEENKPSKWTLRSRIWFNWATPPAILTAVWTAGMWVAESKSVQFDTPQQKSEIIEKSRNLPDALTLKEIGTHVNDPDRHMSLQAKDSTYVRNIQYQIDKYNSLRKEESLIESVEELKVLTRLVFKKIDQIEAKN